jgi:type VII secretion integral membrane protein EccD
MPQAFCRITVVAPTRRVDLTVPADAACGEVLPDVVRLSGEGDQRPPPVSWSLSRLGEPPLALERTLAQSGVLDGDLLYLAPASQRPDPLVVDDLVETIADAVDARGDLWDGQAAHRFLVAAAGAVVGAAAVLLAAAGRPTTASTAAAVAAALSLSLGALALRRARREPVSTTVLALAALPWWALAGASLAGWHGGGPLTVPVAAAAGGLVAGAAAAALTVPGLLGPGLALALPAAALALSALAVVVLGATAVQAAAVVAVCLVPLATALPKLAIRIVRISSGDEDAEVAVQAERAKVAAGHTLLAWLLAGTGATAAAALAVLASSDGILARVLAGVVVVALGLRARAFRSAGQVVPLALGALAGTVALEAAVAATARAGHGDGALGVALLLTTAALLALAGFVARDAAPSPALRQRCNQLETLVNLLLVPIGAGVLGLYTAVERLAQRYGG